MALLCHHLLRLRQFDLFVASLHMCNLHTSGKFSGTDTHKRDTVTVCLIHICLYFKYKCGKMLIKWVYFSDVSFTRQWGIGHF